MTDEYTPSTEQVRIAYTFIGEDAPAIAEQRRAAFDRWLASVKAEAWDEGHDDARQFYAGGPMVPNPYRQGVQ